MKKYFLVSFTLIIVLFFSACIIENDDPMGSSMKGYEIYSWEENSTWNFVITEGTNSVKTYELIVNSEVIYSGEENFKSALSNYSKGERFRWIGEGWLQDCWTTDYGNLCLPPSIIIAEIKAYCKLKGINLSISN